MSDFINPNGKYITQGHIFVCEQCLQPLKDFVEKTEGYSLHQNEWTQELKKGDKCDICGFPIAKESFTFVYSGTLIGGTLFDKFMANEDIVSRRAHHIMNKNKVR